MFITDTTNIHIVQPQSQLSYKNVLLHTIGRIELYSTDTPYKDIDNHTVLNSVVKSICLLIVVSVPSPILLLCLLDNYSCSEQLWLSNMFVRGISVGSDSTINKHIDFIVVLTHVVCLYVC